MFFLEIYTQIEMKKYMPLFKFNFVNPYKIILIKGIIGNILSLIFLLLKNLGMELIIY